MEQVPHDDSTNPSLQTTRLIEVLKNLEGHIRRQNSLRYALIRGMIYGLGTVIGATLLVALFGGIIASTTGIFSDNPTVSKAIDLGSN